MNRLARVIRHELDGPTHLDVTGDHELADPHPVGFQLRAKP